METINNLRIIPKGWQPKKKIGASFNITIKVYFTIVLSRFVGPYLLFSVGVKLYALDLKNKTPF